jgi:hypothetical protein
VRRTQWQVGSRRGIDQHAITCSSTFEAFDLDECGDEVWLAWKTLRAPQFKDSSCGKIGKRALLHREESPGDAIAEGRLERPTTACTFSPGTAWCTPPTSTKTRHAAGEGGFVPRSGDVLWGGKWVGGGNT